LSTAQQGREGEQEARATGVPPTGNSHRTCSAWCLLNFTVL